MKRVFIPVLLALSSCSTVNSTSTPSQPPATNAGAGFKRWIPQWEANDTLVGVVLDASGNVTGEDTVFTAQAGDTSLVIYKGRRYYLFQYKTGLSDNDSTSSQQSYIGVTLNTRPDTIGRPFKTQLAANPATYTMDGAVQKQRQALLFCPQPFFPLVNAGTYLSKRVR